MASYSPPPPTQAATHRAFQTTIPAGPAMPSSLAVINGHNPAFNVSAAQGSAALPAGTEVHVVGVYKGVLPDGQKDTPWWAKCQGDRSDPRAMQDCHARFAGQRSTGVVSVGVARTGIPVALVLMSYEPVIWKLDVSPRTRLKKVILAGYHGQDISGLPTGVSVEARTYESSPCSECTRQSGYFYAYKTDSPEYDKAISAIERITGVAPASFQGVHQSGRFVVNDTVSRAGASPDNPEDAGDVYSGKDFSDQIRVAGQTVSLPGGNWHGLAYLDAPSPRGRDRLVALGRIENNELREVLSLRIQAVIDRKGFPPFSGCTRTKHYAGLEKANESSGVQLCYTVGHVIDAWSQPLLALAARQANVGSASLPDAVVASSFHKADARLAIDVMHYAVPRSDLSRAATSWEKSPWHPKLLPTGSELERFVNQEVSWADTWFQIFSLPDG
ncbi:MAG: hypothetical protein HZA64_07700 [Rhodocyclales bacterium]|nr:hypothetical protein [Rhodocyclales bacterium]